MRIYNAYSGTKEEFIPINGNKVNIYACGITVYDDCHIGHARQAITFDMICRYLRYNGYDVTYVRNYTDVDDKIIARAISEGINALSYSRKKIEEAEKDLTTLKVVDADIKPKASEYIDKIITFIDGLIKKVMPMRQSGEMYTSE
jgi:cysteinyl-tRNA synthetase